jgi:hypothetical protein
MALMAIFRAASRCTASTRDFSEKKSQLPTASKTITTSNSITVKPLRFITRIIAKSFAGCDIIEGVNKGEL